MPDLEKIKEDAKRIIDSFSEKLAMVKVPENEPLVEKKEFERKEGDGKDCDSDFRKIMFENAPNKQGDFIIGERKKWE